MKCTQCGCKKLMQVDIPFFTVDGRVRSSAEIYSCYECGHLEFFDYSSSLEHRSNVLDLDKSTKKLEELKMNLEKLDNPAVLALLEADCKAIEKELTSIDITIRQQQELKSKLYNLQLKLRNTPKRLQI